MPVQDGQLVRQPGWPLGVNNVQPETSLPPGALRVADNVDLDDTGKPRRRAGYTLIAAGVDSRALYHPEGFNFALFARNTELCALLPDESIEVLLSDIANKPVSYTVAVDAVVWSDGDRLWQVTGDRQAARYGVEQPAGQPTLSANGVGGLAAGMYQVAITYETDFGMESGATLAVEIELTEGQGIQLSDVPQPVDAAVTRINIYATQAGGEVLYWRRRLVPGMTSVLLGPGVQGRQLETQFMAPMPAGRFVHAGHGRLYVMRGDTLWYSEPYRQWLTRPGYNYVRFGSDGTMLLPVGEVDGGGLYVAAGGRTYWLGGTDPTRWQRVVAYPHDAVPGTGMLVRASVLGIEGVAATTDVAYWLASNGVFCVGLPGGQVLPLTEGRYLADGATQGASMLREYNGIRQIVTMVDEGPANRAKFSDTMVSTVYRNGVQIG